VRFRAPLHAWKKTLMINLHFIQLVYCFEFLDQNLEAIAYLNKYINKIHTAEYTASGGPFVLWSERL
jgi:hypothetical protein